MQIIQVMFLIFFNLHNTCFTLNLRNVMSVLVMYALESIPQQPVVPEGCLGHI